MLFIYKNDIGKDLAYRDNTILFHIDYTSVYHHLSLLRSMLLELLFVSMTSQPQPVRKEYLHLRLPFLVLTWSGIIQDKIHKK